MSDNTTHPQIYIEKIASFVPTEAKPKPDVSFVPMLTRRRLSYISRMVVLVSDQVSRDKDGNKLTPSKVTFASQFGEANASILETNTAGYSAVFSGKDAFTTGLTDCLAALENEPSDTRTFIFADELIPETYAPVAGVPYPNAVCALALRLTTDESKADPALKNVDVTNQLAQLKMLQNNFDTAAEQAIAFLCAIDMQRN